ncbi:MAG: LEA type 2 family protein, partial [Gammaproteobacteria bacterium]|nr:LEA type 2 family protein [Gammaproteobacteria bacterium]
MFSKRGLKNILMALGVATLLAGCASLGAYKESPRVSLVSIEPLDMTLLEQRYALELRIMNPNSADIPVSGLYYTIEINRREFAYGVSRQAVTIPGHGEAVLEVEVVSNLLGMLRQLQTLQEDQPEALDYRLSGKISLADSPLRLPFDYSGELNWLPP